MKSVGVIGTGTMGAGIAQVFLENNYRVFLYDLSEDLVKSGVQKIKKGLQKKVNKEIMDVCKKEKALGQLYPCTELAALSECILIVEAAIENLRVKMDLFNQLSKIVSENCIFASNTSSLSITQIMSNAERPERTIGVHFFNPAPVMPLVEVVKGFFTSEQTIKIVCEVAESIQKTPVITEESPGFIVNRILIPMINEAAFILNEGIATAKEIDNAMKLGANHPMGPLALADLIGLDVVLCIMETLQKEFGDDKYRPCYLLKTMVHAGQLGRKTGKGFYTY